MNLKEIKDWFKENYHNINLFEQSSIGKINNSLNKAICFYNSKNRNISYIDKLNVSTYTIKPITILIRFDTDQDKAEIVARDLYNFFNKKSVVIGNKNVLFSHIYEDSISLGTDDKGIIEYSLEINIYIKKEEREGTE